MKKVQFVKVRSELSGYGFGKGTRYSFEGVEEIIRQYIENGWEYCGYVEGDFTVDAKWNKISMGPAENFV